MLICLNSVPCPFLSEAIHLISIIQYSQAIQNIQTKDWQQHSLLLIQQAESCQYKGKARSQGTKDKLSLSVAASHWKDTATFLSLLLKFSSGVSACSVPHCFS